MQVIKHCAGNLCKQNATPRCTHPLKLLQLLEVLFMFLLLLLLLLDLPQNQLR